MKAVMYGGGNIGRGFIGLLFRQSSYSVTFVDVAETVVEGLNTRHNYPVRILSNAGHKDITVDGVQAINGDAADAVAAAIADADIMATAVGVNVLKYIVPNLVAGIRSRFQKNSKPLNIIICENMLDADKYLANLIKDKLNEEERALFDERIGLVEAAIGRMVPVQTEAMKDGDPLRVCVERYSWLPVDMEAFKGAVPTIKGMVPYSPFGYYIKRKLFVHNLGHSICAYLGLYMGYEYIWQAIDDPEILLLVKNAMLESAQALAAEYDASMQALLAHIEDLLLRFGNRSLSDTCVRVGGDPVRKLGPNDRLVGAARYCKKHGITPLHIDVGIAAALHRYLFEQELAQNEANAAKAIAELAVLELTGQLAGAIMENYLLFMRGTRPMQLRNKIDEYRPAEQESVV